MKAFRFITIAALAFLGASCAKEMVFETVTEDPNLIPLNISGSIDQVATRATAAGFVNGDAVGLFAVNYTESNSIAGTLATEGNQAEQTPPPAEAEYYDELRMYIGDKVAVIDPMSANAGGTQLGIIDHLAYDSLVYYNINGNYDPCLATEWSANDDATEWTYKLREGVKFHNGEPFTADDVA